jgi:hypothetical protein
MEVLVEGEPDRDGAMPEGAKAMPVNAMAESLQLLR